MAQASELTTIMSDDEAFGGLARQGVDGPMTTSARQLTRRWGWPDDDAHRVKVGRRLKAWEERGLITRQPASDGRQTITIGTLNTTVNNTVNIAVVQPVEAMIAAFPGVHPALRRRSPRWRRDARRARPVRRLDRPPDQRELRQGRLQRDGASGQCRDVVKRPGWARWIGCHAHEGRSWGAPSGAPTGTCPPFQEYSSAWR
jgi:hypothetical protein